MMRLIICLAVCVINGSGAYAQTEASRLRTLYGAPTKFREAPAQEIFTARPRLTLTATYANDRSKVCRIGNLQGAIMRVESRQ